MSCERGMSLRDLGGSAIVIVVSLIAKAIAGL